MRKNISSFRVTHQAVGSADAVVESSEDEPGRQVPAGAVACCTTHSDTTPWRLNSNFY